MKLTTFNPQIVTKNAEPLIKLLEDLGFERRHKQEGIGDFDVTAIRMKDANGFYVDISQVDADIPHDMVAIRMNTDDFETAYDMLTEHGFRNVYGDRSVPSKSAKSAMMISSTGFAINLIHHIKKTD